MPHRERGVVCLLYIYWAKREANPTVLLQLEKLILDWPFDFIWIKGGSPEEQEENMVKYTANMAARIERLREFVGMESQSVMRIVAEAQKIVATKGKKKPSKEAVHAWLDENVKWGVRKCPSVRTVGEILANWETLQASTLVMSFLESAQTRWGRDNLFDTHSKMAAIITRTDKHSLGYAVECIFSQMCRLDKKDPFFGAGIEGLPQRSHVGESVHQVLPGRE